MKKILLLGVLIISAASFGQTAFTSATLDLTLSTGGGGTINRSGIAYNSTQQLYYCVNAGSSGYPLETWDDAGTYLGSVTAGFDYRGAWWNPNTSNFEGNGYSSNGIWIQNLDGSGMPQASGNVDIPATSGPDAQSCGDYDWNDDEILYYNAGTLYRYSRATNTMITSVPVTGLPVATSNLNWNSVSYTGVPGMEAGLYDYITKAFYFIDKQTGAYVQTCTLPGSAPAANAFRMGFDNGYLWLYNTGEWQGYQVVQQCTATGAMITEFVCDNFSAPSGNVYSTTGIHYDTIPNAAGCDSIIQIDLTVGNTTDSIVETSCESYIAPSGAVYTASGIYYDTISNSLGCDSLITLDITILPNNIDNSVTQTGEQLLANQLVAAYQWVDCGNDYMDINGEVNQVFEPTISGSYAVVVTMDGCSIMSDCFDIDFTGIPTLDQQINVFPNPAVNELNIEGLNDIGEINRITISSLEGRLVELIENPKDSIKIKTSDWESGVYFVNIPHQSGLITKIVVKQ